MPAQVSWPHDEPGLKARFILWGGGPEGAIGLIWQLLAALDGKLALTPCPSPVLSTMSTWSPTAGGRGEQ
jgi:hypothetical protein